MMLINLEFDKDQNLFKASTQWMNPEWKMVTTVGVSSVSFEEAIGRMIGQIGACYGSPIVQTYTQSDGNIILQPKM